MVVAQFLFVRKANKLKCLKKLGFPQNALTNSQVFLLLTNNLDNNRSFPRINVGFHKK